MTAVGLEGFAAELAGDRLEAAGAGSLALFGAALGAALSGFTLLLTADFNAAGIAVFTDVAARSIGLAAAGAGFWSIFNGELHRCISDILQTTNEFEINLDSLGGVSVLVSFLFADLDAVDEGIYRSRRELCDTGELLYQLKERMHAGISVCLGGNDLLHGSDFPFQLSLLAVVFGIHDSEVAFGNQALDFIFIQRSIQLIKMVIALFAYRQNKTITIRMHLFSSPPPRLAKHLHTPRKNRFLLSADHAV